MFENVKDKRLFATTITLKKKKVSQYAVLEFSLIPSISVWQDENWKSRDYRKCISSSCSHPPQMKKKYNSVTMEKST